MQKPIIKYGIYALVFAFVAFFAGLYFDLTTNVYVGYATIIASLMFVYFGIKHFRDRENNGVVSFKQALIIGLLISVITAIGIALADFVYTSVIDPDFYTNYAEKMREEDPSAEIQEYTSSFGALFMLVVVTIVGFIISLLSALILQRKNQ